MEPTKIFQNQEKYFKIEKIVSDEIKKKIMELRKKNFKSRKIFRNREKNFRIEKNISESRKLFQNQEIFC